MNKKLFSLFLSLLMLFAFTACSNEPEPTENIQNNQSDEIVSTDPSADTTLPGGVTVISPGDTFFDDEGNKPSNSIETDPADATDPSTGIEVDPSGTTDPSEGTDETTTPTTPTTSTPPTPGTTSYEAYNAMSPEEQLAFFNTFDSMEDFVAWYNAAKAEYEAQNPGIDIGDGNIDIGDIIGGGN